VLLCPSTRPPHTLTHPAHTSDGRYGFLEFRNPDYATAALQLNGQVALMGQTLNIGRPASYVDPNKVCLWVCGVWGVCWGGGSGLPVQWGV
jgi:hypothetical protein